MKGRRQACAMRLLTALVGLGLLAPAFAALPPQYYQRARENAGMHLQLRVEKVKLIPLRQLHNCQIQATVLHDFRGDTLPGTPVEFDLNCTTATVRPMPGPDAWHDYQGLKSAQFMEGFFNGIPPHASPVYGQIRIIDSERDSPWCEAETGRCTLPPPQPALVLECSQAGLGGLGRRMRSGWLLKVGDHRMWFWSDIGKPHAGDGRHWQAHLWPPQRLPYPLVIEPGTYRHVAHFYSEGGEQLLMERHFSIDRTTLDSRKRP